MTSTPADFLRALEAATPETTPPQTRARLRRQARTLNLSCALPAWFSDTDTHPATAAHLTREAQQTVHAKALLTGYPENVLALAYLRALRALRTQHQLPPGLTAHDAAQARVNALIQLADLDPTASPQDEDLLPLMQQTPQNAAQPD